jgi:glycerol uptake facilitator-like aquaporin
LAAVTDGCCVASAASDRDARKPKLTLLSSAAQNVGTLAALGVGDYIALAGLWAPPVSGVSTNPARSFWPVLVSGYWTSCWV